MPTDPSIAARNRLYVVNENPGSSCWHLAAHEPSGYGIRTLCGLTWDTDFRTHGPGVAGPVCFNCRRVEASRAA